MIIGPTAQAVRLSIRVWPPRAADSDEVYIWHIPCIYHVYPERTYMPGIYHVYTIDIKISVKFHGFMCRGRNSESMPVPMIVLLVYRAAMDKDNLMLKPEKFKKA